MTCIDTNIFSLIWNRHPNAKIVIHHLEQQRRKGNLVISPIVYAELFAYPNITELFLQQFLEDTEVTVDEHLSFQSICLAGERYADYAKRRLSEIGQPRRILADFLVGAHALEHKAVLLTFDKRRYQTDFPELELIYPV